MLDFLHLKQTSIQQTDIGSLNGRKDAKYNCFYLADKKIHLYSKNNLFARFASWFNQTVVVQYQGQTLYVDRKDLKLPQVTKPTDKSSLDKDNLNRFFEIIGQPLDERTVVKATPSFQLALEKANIEKANIERASSAIKQQVDRGSIEWKEIFKELKTLQGISKTKYQEMLEKVCNTVFSSKESPSKQLFCQFFEQSFETRSLDEEKAIESVSKIAKEPRLTASGQKLLLLFWDIAKEFDLEDKLDETCYREMLRAADALQDKKAVEELVRHSPPLSFTNGEAPWVVNLVVNFSDWPVAAIEYRLGAFIRDLQNSSSLQGIKKVLSNLTLQFQTEADRERVVNFLEEKQCLVHFEAFGSSPPMIMLKGYDDQETATKKAYQILQAGVASKNATIKELFQQLQGKGIFDKEIATNASLQLCEDVLKQGSPKIAREILEYLFEADLLAPKDKINFLTQLTIAIELGEHGPKPHQHEMRQFKELVGLLLECSTPSAYNDPKVAKQALTTAHELIEKKAFHLAFSLLEPIQKYIDPARNKSEVLSLLNQLYKSPEEAINSGWPRLHSLLVNKIPPLRVENNQVDIKGWPIEIATLQVLQLAPTFSSSQTTTLLGNSSEECQTLRALLEKKFPYMYFLDKGTSLVVRMRDQNLFSQESEQANSKLADCTTKTAVLTAIEKMEKQQVQLTTSPCYLDSIFQEQQLASPLTGSDIQQIVQKCLQLRFQPSLYTFSEAIRNRLKHGEDGVQEAVELSNLLLQRTYPQEQQSVLDTTVLKEVVEQAAKFPPKATKELDVITTLLMAAHSCNHMGFAALLSHSINHLCQVKQSKRAALILEQLAKKNIGLKEVSSLSPLPPIQQLVGQLIKEKQYAALFSLIGTFSKDNKTHPVLHSSIKETIQEILQTDPVPIQELEKGLQAAMQCDFQEELLHTLFSNPGTLKATKLGLLLQTAEKTNPSLSLNIYKTAVQTVLLLDKIEYLELSNFLHTYGMSQNCKIALHEVLGPFLQAALDDSSTTLPDARVVLRMNKLIQLMLDKWHVSPTSAMYQQTLKHLVRTNAIEHAKILLTNMRVDSVPVGPSLQNALIAKCFLHQQPAIGEELIDQLQEVLAGEEDQEKKQARYESILREVLATLFEAPPPQKNANRKSATSFTVPLEERATATEALLRKFTTSFPDSTPQQALVIQEKLQELLSKKQFEAPSIIGLFKLLPDNESTKQKLLQSHLDALIEQDLLVEVLEFVEVMQQNALYLSPKMTTRLLEKFIEHVRPPLSDRLDMDNLTEKLATWLEPLLLSDTKPLTSLLTTLLKQPPSDSTKDQIQLLVSLSKQVNVQEVPPPLYNNWIQMLYEQELKNGVSPTEAIDNVHPFIELFASHNSAFTYSAALNFAEPSAKPKEIQLEGLPLPLACWALDKYFQTLSIEEISQLTFSLPPGDYAKGLEQFLQQDPWNINLTELPTPIKIRLGDAVKNVSTDLSIRLKVASDLGSKRVVLQKASGRLKEAHTPEAMLAIVCSLKTYHILPTNEMLTRVVYKFPLHERLKVIKRLDAVFPGQVTSLALLTVQDAIKAQDLEYAKGIYQQFASIHPDLISKSPISLAHYPKEVIYWGIEEQLKTNNQLNTQFQEIDNVYEFKKGIQRVLPDAHFSWDKTKRILTVTCASKTEIASRLCRQLKATVHDAEGFRITLQRIQEEHIPLTAPDFTELLTICSKKLCREDLAERIQILQRMSPEALLDALSTLCQKGTSSFQAFSFKQYMEAIDRAGLLIPLGLDLAKAICPKIDANKIQNAKNLSFLSSRLIQNTLSKHGTKAALEMYISLSKFNPVLGSSVSSQLIVEAELQNNLSLANAIFAQNPITISPVNHSLDLRAFPPTVGERVFVASVEEALKKNHRLRVQLAGTDKALAFNQQSLQRYVASKLPNIAISILQEKCFVTDGPRK